MGTYLNPGLNGFQEIIKNKYVDKTSLISLINHSIGTNQKLTCISRPRRFGKSYTAQMLCAYYDKTCDSSNLFAPYKIAADETYRAHLNQYDVIYLDMTTIMGEAEGDLISFIRESVTEEIMRMYPKVRLGRTFSSTLLNTVEYTGNKFVMIIDEWDAPIRERPSAEKEYLQFLRTMFKSSAITAKLFAAVYMTGILPVKKDGTQSAVSDFREFTMIKPRKYAEYVGFTEQEVKSICSKYGLDFQKMKEWYDGYSFPNVGSVYNPNSVMQAVENHDFDSYWTQTSAAESLMKFIGMDFDGLSRCVAELIGGGAVPVNTLGFANDLQTFRNKDDILTLMIHLGYLTYDVQTECVHIPNEEIRLEFASTIRDVKRDETIQRVRESDRLFLDTIHGDEEAVAAQIEKIHREETAPLFYNREEDLRSIIKLAYFSYKDHYIRFEELPSGEGYADIVYLPKRTSAYPALVIELKWKESAESAIAQIRDHHYPEALQGYGGDILLVGISYSKDQKDGNRKHTCRIEARKYELLRD